MRYVMRLQGLVSGIHGQQQCHQYDLGQQYDGRIFNRPAFQLLHVQALQLQYISAHKEYHERDKHQRGQYFKEPDKEGIQVAQHGGKHAVHAQHTIQEYFQYLYVDDHKTHIHCYVQEGSRRALEHFFLSQCQQYHISPAFTFIIRQVFIPAQ